MLCRSKRQTIYIPSSRRKDITEQKSPKSLGTHYQVIFNTQKNQRVFKNENDEVEIKPLPET